MVAVIPCLDPERSLPNVPQWRWGRLVADYDTFTTGEWAARAAKLGWNDVSLFGCHRDMPWVSTWWGALWFVLGGKINDIGPEVMRVTPPRGVQRSISRMHHTYDFIVPVWRVCTANPE